VALVGTALVGIVVVVALVGTVVVALVGNVVVALVGTVVVALVGIVVVALVGIVVVALVGSVVVIAQVGVVFVVVLLLELVDISFHNLFACCSKCKSLRTRLQSKWRKLRLNQK